MTMATARQLEHAKTDLYEQDFLAWIDDQAQALRERQTGALDWENLREEIESMGRSQRNELKSRLRVLLMHLIKWHWQPEKRTASWTLTIKEQRAALADLLETSPSLKTGTPRIIPSVWTFARDAAATETGMGIDTFPESCPWDMDTHILADWWPE
ncbi:MAG: DUF29 domain-containing protein [Acidithiobacillus sp.]